VLQVSDRLVVAETKGTILRPFDALANKDLIYWARDAIVSIGYTGPAYIGKLPTDDWIAERLTGVNVSELSGTKFGLLPQWLDIGQSMTVLEQELKQSEVAKGDLNFELVMAGWQWKHGRRPLTVGRQPVPMAWWIRKPRNSNFFDSGRLPPRWHWKRGVCFEFSPEENLSKGELKKMFDRLGTGCTTR
jgi:hypothetical protein